LLKFVSVKASIIIQGNIKQGLPFNNVYMGFAFTVYIRWMEFEQCLLLWFALEAV